MAAPVGNFFQTFSASVLEQPDFVAGVLEFVDVSPDLRLPRSLVRLGLATTGAAGVKSNRAPGRCLHIGLHIVQLDEDAAHLFDLVITAENVLVTQQVSKGEFARFRFRFLPGMKWPIFGPQLLRRITGHPENILVRHAYPSLVL
jgi:hypothetical protein